MTARTYDDPGPPNGVERRRACSDNECMEARNRWFTEELLPKLMIRFWIGIATTVVALASVFMYLSTNAIRDFELKATHLYEGQSHHDEDIAKIEIQFGKLSDQLLTLGEKMDRNIEYMRRRSQ